MGALLGYTIAAVAPFLPSLYFFPRLGTWGWASVPGEPAIRWYGWLLYAAAGGLLGWGAGRFINRRPAWFLVCLVAAASLLLLTWHGREWFLK